MTLNTQDGKGFFPYEKTGWYILYGWRSSNAEELNAKLLGAKDMYVKIVYSETNIGIKVKVAKESPHAKIVPTFVSLSTVLRFRRRVFDTELAALANAVDYALSRALSTQDNDPAVSDACLKLAERLMPRVRRLAKREHPEKDRPTVAGERGGRKG